MNDQLNQLEQDHTFAGQECILALSQALNIRILESIPNNNQMTTMENYMPPPLGSNTDIPGECHIIWSRRGGGHYNVATESVSPGNQQRDTDSVGDHNDISNIKH